MRTLKWLIAGVLGLAAIVLAVGVVLPPKFTVTRSVLVNAPPDKIYPLVADPRGWKQWSVWNQRDPSMQVTYSGPPTGAGAKWEWKSASEGNGAMTFTAAEPAKRVAFDLSFPDLGTSSSGELNFVPQGYATQVTWTMNGDMGKNPVAHWFALFADNMVGKDFEGGLANLKRLAEKP